MKPLAYGYMRVFCNVKEEDVCSVEQRISECAQELGFQLAATFQEVINGSHQVFYELIEELQHSDIAHVIVPSFNHFSKNGLLQNLMSDQLSELAGVEVHTLREWAASLSTTDEG